MRFCDTSRIRTRFDERVTMTDGTQLSVDLYLPPVPGQYPALLHRTAADNNREGRPGISLAPAERWKVMAANGYIVATADVRGRGDSDGRFLPFANEAADGAVTAVWLRRFEECNGRVGVFGCGYSAFCAWAAAIADGNIDAIVSVSPFGLVGKDLLHREGVVRLDWLFWMHLIAGRTVQPANVPRWSGVHRHLPIGALHEALGREDIWWREWLDHGSPGDPYWAHLDLAQEISKLSLPGLHITGRWDGYVNAAYRYYEAACRSGAPQQLISGPWDTAAVRRPVSRVGGFEFGPRSVIDLDETIIEFFDRSLAVKELRPEASVRVFVTGRNEWMRDDGTAVTGTEVLPLYLCSDRGANTRRGDGMLRSAPAAQASVSVITHNPAVPVEFQPRFISFASGANPMEFTLDQMHVTGRDEALVYTSEPLETTLTACGYPKVALTVRTDAQDADLFVLLSDSFPLGIRDLHLSHAAVRLRTIGSFQPGKLINIEMELDPIAHDFQEGHQIRITVTPSLFPLYARNLHLSDYAMGREPVVAEIELHCGPDAKSHLVLPVKAGA